MSFYQYNYSFNTDEDQVLLDMLNYFDDIGLPEHIDQKAYDSLSEKFFKNNSSQMNFTP